MTPEPPSPSRFPLAVMAALAVVAVGAGAWLVTRQLDPPPPPTEVEAPRSLCPPNTIPEPGANVVEVSGRRVPDAVVFERANQRVRFRLVVPPAPEEPFYAPETRVWYALYASLRYPEPGLPPPVALSGPDDTRGRAPVTDLTGRQARKFVNYAFGGDLPSADEWEHATKLFGKDDGREWLRGDGDEWPLRGGKGDGPGAASPASVVPGAGFRVVLKVPK